MSNFVDKKSDKLRARLPRGLKDSTAAECEALEDMLAQIRGVYKRYGFEPVETPYIEYTDALGKFLPDLDRPNEGVFSFQDDDDQWLSLRYDLTAPLARYVAENFQFLPKPYRSYRMGPVFRNEKPGPGRYRQFLQFDADTVGSASPASDAEMCMMMADTLEAVGLSRGDYVVKVSTRKILDGVLETCNLAGDENLKTRLIVLRAIDKLDRLGVNGVRDLLGAGRKDESGDFTQGADLSADQIDKVMTFVDIAKLPDAESALQQAEKAVGESETGKAGVEDIRAIADYVSASGYGADRIRIDPSIVRGLEYYTGAVFEAEVTFPVKNDKGKEIVFGSVAGGGRYDGLVARFRGEVVPATGFSIGVSRLLAALAAKTSQTVQAPGPVVVFVMDKNDMGTPMRLAKILRDAGIPAEAYLGTNTKMDNQFKYAEKRGSLCAVIQGSNEKDKGEVQIKDLIAGAQKSDAGTDNEAYRAQRSGQVTIAADRMVQTVREIYARHNIVLP